MGINGDVISTALCTSFSMAIPIIAQNEPTVDMKEHRKASNNMALNFDEMALELIRTGKNKQTKIEEEYTTPNPTAAIN